MNDAVARLRRSLWSAPEGRLRAPWRLALTGALVFALGNALSVGAIAAAQLGAWLAPALRAVWTIVVAGIALAATIGGVLAIARLVDRRPLADLGLPSTAPFRRELALGLTVGAGMAVATVGVAAGFGLASVAGVLTGWTGTVALTAQHPLLSAAFWLVVFVGVGVIEEVLLRGYVIVNVAEGLRGRTADAGQATIVGVLASGAVAGVLHVTAPDVSVVGVATVVVAGLVLGTTVALTGRLALAIGVHVAWNVTLGLGFGLPVAGIDTGAAVVAVELSGPAIVTGGSFGPVGGLLGVVGMGLGLASLAWWLGRRPGGLEIDPALADPDLGPVSVRERRDRQPD